VNSDNVPVRLLLTAAQAAAALGVSRTKLYELVGDGAVVPLHIGRSVRLPVSELERFVASLSRHDGGEAGGQRQLDGLRRAPGPVERSRGSVAS
jgi:excisionase family DNA binding protein